MRIRLAQSADVESLASIDPVALAGAEGRAAAIRTHVAQGRVLVADLESQVIGYVATTPGHFLGHDFVELLIVAATHRRRGVGTALLRAAVGPADGRRIFTSTNSSNRPMKGLLASCGWTHSGTVDGLDPGDPEEFYYIDR